MEHSPRNLTGKVALVTGGSRGIGAATSKRLAAHGAKVGVNYHHNRPAADQVVSEIMAQGGEAVAIQADVAGPDSAPRLIDAVLDRYGKLDILVNNAAVIDAATLDALNEEQFELQFRTNVKA